MENPPVRNPSGPVELKLDCPARTNALHAALDAIEQACDTWKIDKVLVSRARIVVEELFTNTIKYGYGGECAKLVRLTVRPLPRLTLIYEDEAPAFDPLAWKARPEDPLQDRPLGLAGIAMVRGLSAGASYERRDDANCLTIIFAEKN